MNVLPTDSAVTHQWNEVQRIAQVESVKPSPSDLPITPTNRGYLFNRDTQGGAAVSRSTYYVYMPSTTEVLEYRQAEKARVLLGQFDSVLDEIGRNLSNFEQTVTPAVSPEVLETGRHLIRDLCFNGLFPRRLEPSIEGGLYLSFKHANQVMHLELYNTGEQGYIIEDLVARKTVRNQDLASFEAILTEVKFFLEP